LSEEKSRRKIIHVKKLAPIEVAMPPHIVEDRDEAPIREEVVRLSEMYGETRDELVGLLKSRVNIGNMVKEQMVYLSEQQQGIINAVKMLFKPKVPWTLILLTVLAVSVIVIVGSNPEYVRQLNIFFANPANQAFVLAFLIIVALIIYFIYRRRSRAG